jgi:hypothetical protein
MVTNMQMEVVVNILCKQTWLRGLSGDFFHSFHIMSLY